MIYRFSHAGTFGVCLFVMAVLGVLHENSLITEIMHSFTTLKIVYPDMQLLQPFEI